MMHGKVTPACGRRSSNGKWEMEIYRELPFCVSLTPARCSIRQTSFLSGKSVRRFLSSFVCFLWRRVGGVDPGPRLFNGGRPGGRFPTADCRGTSGARPRNWARLSSNRNPPHPTPRRPEPPIRRPVPERWAPRRGNLGLAEIPEIPGESCGGCTRHQGGRFASPESRAI